MRPSKYNAELLGPIVRASHSVAAVLRVLGLRPTGGNHRMISARIRVAGLDTAHFRGQGWSRGETKTSNATVARTAKRNSMTDAQVFVACSSYLEGPGVVRRFLAKGWRYECAWCGIATWRDQPLVLHLDHINGINNDHRLENLRLLCPNCHSQTPTYGNRARDRGACYTFGRASVA